MSHSRRGLFTGAAVLGVLAVGGMLPALCARQQMANGWPKPATRRPIRPAGTPKPLIEEDIETVLARLDSWFAANLAPDRYTFNPPASDAALDAFERLVGMRMPRAFRQLYRWHDGENDDRRGHFYGLPLLPLREAGSQWQSWNRILAQFDGNRYVVPAAGWPAGAVDPAYINPRWIPLTSDGSGNHIGVDFDPWPGGRVGQIILFGRDEDVKTVLAPSLGAFLAWVAGLLEGGNFRLKARAGETVLREFRLKAPAVDGFHEGARILLGAPRQFL